MKFFLEQVNFFGVFTFETFLFQTPLFQIGYFLNKKMNWRGRGRSARPPPGWRAGLSGYPLARFSLCCRCDFFCSAQKVLGPQNPPPRKGSCEPLLPWVYFRASKGCTQQLFFCIGRGDKHNKKKGTNGSTFLVRPSAAYQPPNKYMTNNNNNN